MIVQEIIEVEEESHFDPNTETHFPVNVMGQWIVFSDEEKDALIAKGYTPYPVEAHGDGVDAYCFPKIKIADILETLPYPFPQLAWMRVEEVLKTHFENPDIESVKVMLAAMAAHRIEDYPPVWPLLIAPSGSMKTAIVDSLRGLPHVHFVDEVTPNTFISGMLNKDNKKRKTPASLLHRIGNNGILIMADFSTVISEDKRTRQKVLSQLRRIYDGNFSREFGSNENLDERQWEGRLTVIACVTLEIDRYTSIFQALGLRPPDKVLIVSLYNLH